MNGRVLPIAAACWVLCAPPGLVSPASGALIYVDPVNGDDATGQRGQPDKPFKTIFHYDDGGDEGSPSTNGALTVVQYGDVIKLSAGVITNDQSIALPPNCSLIGSGKRATILRSAAGIYAYGPVVQPGDNAVVAGLSIECTRDGDTFRSPLGISYVKSRSVPGTTRPFTNVVVYDVMLNGQSDGVYIDHTNTITATFCNVEIESDWDGVLFSTRGNTSSQLEFYNCSISVQSRDTIMHSYASGLVLDEGTTRWFGGQIAVKDGPESTFAVWARRPGSRVELYGTRLYTPSTNGWVYDIGNVGNMKIFDTMLDTNKIANLGTIAIYNWQPSNPGGLSIVSHSLPRVTLSGMLGSDYQIDVSTNLIDWSPFLILPNAYGTLQFIDLTATNYPARFYRTRFSP